MFSSRTFPGGIHLRGKENGKRATGAKATVPMPAPKSVAILLAQHVGTPCKSLVKTGDCVKLGQKIGEPTGYVGAPVHSSVSGTVKALDTRLNAAGQTVNAIIIENDFQDAREEPISHGANVEALNKLRLLSIIREAGVVGLGGAGFPTAIKLNPPEGKKIEVVIVNGAECEPYLTCDHRAMLEMTDEIIDGLLLVKRIVAASRLVIAIEVNKPDAIAQMRRAVEGKGIDIQPLKARYPQGGEKQLIYAVTGKEVPSGGFPMDAGALVINVSTAAAISAAIRRGHPVTERIMTVTGAVKEPQNLRVRIGTPISDLIDFCGGATDKANKLIFGGPMMGQAAYDLRTPVVKTTSGILLLEDGGVRPEGNCIRCGTCVRQCPVKLMPLDLYKYSKNALFEEGKQNHAMDCIECGVCSFVCPARIPLTHAIRVIKREVARRRL